MSDKAGTRPFFLSPLSKSFVMRRKDREISDYSEIIRIIESCSVCRLGLMDENEAYIVPMNFGYIVENKDLTLYFHSAKEGRK